MRAHLIWILPLVALGCSYDPAELSPDELRTLESSIVNGKADPGHPAVGMLTTQGYGICTATLVGTHTVVTASHCVVNEDHPPYTLRQQIGWSRDGVSAPIPAATVIYHPDYDHGAGGLDHDIAVLRLSQDVTDITPRRIAQTPPAVGEDITLVGFGYTADSASSTFGTRRLAQNTIGKVTPSEIVFYGANGGVGNICSGDSGGPAFAVRGGEELLVGIHSWGEGECGVAEHDARADIHHGWVAQQAQGNLYDGAQADLQPPKVQILSPAPQTQVSASFQVNVSAEDDVEVSRVELFVDGKLFDSRQTAPYTFVVDGLAAGAHSIRAEAVDSAGQRASASVTVQVAGGSQDPQPNPANPASPDPQPTDPANPQSPADPGTLVGACNLGAGAPSGPPVLLGLVLLPLLRRRRRD